MIKTYNVIYNPQLDRSFTKENTIDVEEVGECPCCHIATSPTYINGFMISSKENQIPVTAFLVLCCPRCNSIYIAKYTGKLGLGKADLHLEFVFPQQSNLKVFSDEIITLSPEFVSIYNQALEAESNITTQGLAGLGYRKALEFLIKDYLIKFKHQNKDTIIKLELNKCVDKLDAELKDIATASTWIGNDETHYFRKNKEYDTQALKTFINCLVTEIEHKYAKEKAKAFVHNK